MDKHIALSHIGEQYLHLKRGVYIPVYAHIEHCVLAAVSFVNNAAVQSVGKAAPREKNELASIRVQNQPVYVVGENYAVIYRLKTRFSKRIDMKGFDIAGKGLFVYVFDIVRKIQLGKGRAQKRIAFDKPYRIG